MTTQPLCHATILALTSRCNSSEVVRLRAIASPAPSVDYVAFHRNLLSRDEVCFLIVVFRLLRRLCTTTQTKFLSFRHCYSDLVLCGVCNYEHRPSSDFALCSMRAPPIYDPHRTLRCAARHTSPTHLWSPTYSYIYTVYIYPFASLLL